jgi:hypothetical protein
MFFLPSFARNIISQIKVMVKVQKEGNLKLRKVLTHRQTLLCLLLALDHQSPLHFVKHFSVHMFYELRVFP